MIPKVAGKGTSFKGAGLYYLHDKQAMTKERVAFTLTHNLPTDDPDLALKSMAYTAMHQADIKAAFGAAKTGRKLTQSVYTYSLSWHPDEKPTREQMIEAARETLKLLGLDQHEALLVAHNDEPHPHIHLIVNRVHPETGIAAKLSNDHLELSKWAEEYERRHGKILCEQRVANNNKRRKGEFARDTKSLSDAEYKQWKRAQERQGRPPALEPDISGLHRRQRDALYAAKEQRVAQHRAVIKEQNRPTWAFLFRQQQQERRELDATRRSAFARLLYWVQHRQDIKTRGGLAGAFAALLGWHGPDFADAMARRHEAERKALSTRISQQTRDALAQENAQYHTDLDRLRHDQAAERKTMREAYADARAADGSAVTRDLNRPAKSADRDRPATPREEFAQRVGKRIRRARKRREERGKGIGREREE